MPIPEEMLRFKKMLNFGVPLIGVRNKMIQEGYSPEDFDQYVNPETAIADDEEEQEEENNVEDEESDNEDDEESSERDEDEEKKPEEDNNNVKSSDSTKPKYNFVPEVDNDEIKMNNLQSIPIKKALLIVNTFIVNTTSFLNKFVSHCETKLHEIHKNTQKLETSLMLLEGKLNSVKWLESAQKGEIKNPTMAKSTPGGENNNNDSNKDETKQNDGENNEDSENEENEENDNANGNDDDAIKNDPDLQPWFKMLKVKVPEQAVRNKMAQSGVDPDTIEKVIELSR